MYSFFLISQHFSQKPNIYFKVRFVKWNCSNITMYNVKTVKASAMQL